MNRSSRFLPVVRVIASSLILLPSLSWGNPSGGRVVSGAATIVGAGNTLTVSQLTNYAIINWRDFSINSGQLTQFLQPSAASAALNRVTGGNPSAIYGTLRANGSLYLINPNGITVGPSGVVNAQSFIASALDISDSEFLSGGNLTFSGNSNAGVSNAGTINALGGDILLVAHTVQNTGSLNAAGTAGMAAGSEVLFLASGDQRVFVEAGSGHAATGVSQKGQIQAATAELAAAGGNVYGLAVNNQGVIKATGVRNLGGHVYLTANGGSVSDTGPLTASGQGGQVTVTGELILLGGNVVSNGSQAYVGAVRLTADDTLTGDGIAFRGVLDGAQTLDLNPGQGTVTFDGRVGENAPLAALTVTGVTDIEGGAVTTSGDQAYNGAVIVNPNAVITSKSGSLGFNGPVNVGNNLTANSSEGTTLNGPVLVGGALTVNITGSGSISLQVGSQNYGGTITSGGDQTYNGPIFVGTPMTLDSLYGSIRLNGFINGVYSSNVAGYFEPLTTDSALDTTFNGSVTLGGLVANITSPYGVIRLNAGSIYTYGGETFNGPVGLLKSTTIFGDDADITFNGTVDGGYDLAVEGGPDTTATFAGAVGSIVPLTGLSVDAEHVLYLDGAPHIQ